MTDENHLLRLINKHMRHDVLNNLASIRSILEVYQDRKDEDLLNNVYNQVERSVEFLKRMKEVESLLPGSSLKFLRVSEVLEGVIDKHGVECNVRGDCEVIADEGLSAVFDNLIENAVAHGGADRVDIDIQDRGKTCQIEVADNGQGIPEDIEDSVFEEGFSGGRGTGLGLYIIKKTIERYGGTIHVKDNSQTSHGTTFVLTLYTQFGLNDSGLNTTDQKWAERKLRESEEKYRNFFQTSRDAVFITSKEGNWIDMNDATVELFGYESKEELMKVKVPHIYADPADREEHIRAIEQWGFIEEYPVNLRRKDGSVINALITSVPVRDEYGVVIGFQGTIRDVTEHRQMEESYRALVESAGDNIYVLDNDMRFLHANTKYLERIGATLDGIVGKHYGDSHSKKGTKRFQERVNEVRERRKTLTYEYRSDRDGRYFLRTLSPQINRETGEIDGITVISKDITEQKEVEERLRESEEKYRSLFENSPIVVWEEDFSSLKDYVDDLKKRVEDLEGYLEENPEEVMKCFKMIDIIDVNRVALDHYGASTKEELIQNLGNLVCEETYGSLKNEIIAIAEGKTYYRTETVAKTLDGKERDELLELRVPEEYQDDFSRVYVTAIDITERKLTERKLRESEEKYRTLYESSIDGIAESDLDGNLISCNQAYLDITGYNFEQIKGLQYQDLTPEKWRGLDEDHVKQAVERGYSEVYEKECFRRDGAVIPISIRVWLKKDRQGKPIGLWRIVRDITERKKWEEKLKESEEKYRATFEFTGTAMMIIEEDTTLSMVNTKFEEISGYTKEEVEGKISWTEIVHPDDVEKMKKYQYHQTRRRKEQVPNKYEFRFVDKEGNVKSALLHIGLILGTKKSVASVIDITYLKRLHTLLETISDINELVAKEKNPDRVMNAVCSKLRNLYKAVFTSLIEDGELEPVKSEGIDMQSLKKTINQCPSITRAMEGELMKVATDSDLCKHCTKEQHNYALSIPLTHEKQHGVITIHSISDISEEEITLLQKLASNVGFALFAYEVEESEKRAIEQLQNNFRQFEKTADRLRNPLAIIMSSLESTDYYRESEILKIVNEQAERIKDELNNLRREEMQTFELVEKFREYKE